MVCTEERIDRIAGGFVMIPVADLLTTWRACQSRPLGIADFRTWLAAHEMTARRSRTSFAGRSPAYTVSELANLLGGLTPRRVRASLRRLVAAGLLSFTGTSIEFPVMATQGADGLDAIGSGRGSIPVPRRLLRWLAAGQSGRIISTALAVLLRSLSRRRDGWRGWGRIKSAWIASTFGISTRQAKAARAELASLGWLTSQPSPAWTERRYGRAFAISLDWVPPTSAHPRTGRASLSPQAAGSGASLTPLDQTLIPLGIERNQEPAQPPIALAGSCGQDQKEVKTQERRGSPARAVVATHTTTPPNASSVATHTADQPPTLKDVRVEDLADVKRLLTLHREAILAGLARDTEASRLAFVASATHARCIGRANPAGLFAETVRRGWYRFASTTAEDQARRMLKAHDRAKVETVVAFVGTVASVAAQSPSLGGPAPSQVDPVSVPTPAVPRRSTFVPDKRPDAGPVAISKVLSGFCGSFRND